MSCGACNCEDCQQEREAEKALEVLAGLRPLPPPLPVQVQQRRPSPEWLPLINAVFQRFGHDVRINMPALASMVLRDAGVEPWEYREWDKSLTKFILEELPNRGYSLLKGRMGGICKSQPAPKPWHSEKLDGSNFILPTSGYSPTEAQAERDADRLCEMAHAQTKPVGSAENVAPPDNYTCVCGNAKLNTANDKVCWRCGEPVKA